MNGKGAEGLEVTSGRALAVLWGFFWRIVFLAGVVNAVVAGVLGMLVAFILTPPIASVVSAVTFTLLMLAAAVPTMRTVLTTRFSDFSIRLVPNDDEPPVA